MLHASFALCRRFTAVNVALLRLPPFSLGRTQNPWRSFAHFHLDSYEQAPRGRRPNAEAGASLTLYGGVVACPWKFASGRGSSCKMTRAAKALVDRLFLCAFWDDRTGKIAFSKSLQRYHNEMGVLQPDPSGGMKEYGKPSCIFSLGIVYYHRAKTRRCMKHEAD